MESQLRGLVPEHSINATVAVLENMGDAIATGVLAGQSISEITGPGFYDNTKTNWAALLDEGDAGRYNLGLSGDDGIAPNAWHVLHWLHA